MNKMQAKQDYVEENGVLLDINKAVEKYIDSKKESLDANDTYKIDITFVENMGFSLDDEISKARLKRILIERAPDATGIDEFITTVKLYNGSNRIIKRLNIPPDIYIYLYLKFYFTKRETIIEIEYQKIPDHFLCRKSWKHWDDDNFRMSVLRYPLFKINTAIEGDKYVSNISAYLNPYQLRPTEVTDITSEDYSDLKDLLDDVKNTIRRIESSENIAGLKLKEGAILLKKQGKHVVAGKISYIDEEGVANVNMFNSIYPQICECIDDIALGDDIQLYHEYTTVFSIRNDRDRQIATIFNDNHNHTMHTEGMGEVLVDLYNSVALADECRDDNYDRLAHISNICNDMDVLYDTYTGDDIAILITSIGTKVLDRQEYKKELDRLERELCVQDPNKKEGR